MGRGSGKKFTLHTAQTMLPLSSRREKSLCRGEGLVGVSEEEEVEEAEEGQKHKLYIWTQLTERVVS